MAKQAELNGSSKKVFNIRVELNVRKKVEEYVSTSIKVTPIGPTPDHEKIMMVFEGLSSATIEHIRQNFTPEGQLIMYKKLIDFANLGIERTNMDQLTPPVNPKLN